VTELLAPGVNGRPSIWMVGAVRVYLSVRDRAVLDEAARVRQRVMDAHPDRGGSTTRFLMARASQRAFYRRVLSEYAPLGIEPPLRISVTPHGGKTLKRVEQIAEVTCACGRPFNPAKPGNGTRARYCAHSCPARRRAPRGIHRRPRLRVPLDRTV